QRGGAPGRRGDPAPLHGPGGGARDLRIRVVLRPGGGRGQAGRLDRRVAGRRAPRRRPLRPVRRGVSACVRAHSSGEGTTAMLVVLWRARWVALLARRIRRTAPAP